VCIFLKAAQRIIRLIFRIIIKYIYAAFVCQLRRRIVRSKQGAAAASKQCLTGTGCEQEYSRTPPL
jgi:hypothetical protein